VFEISRRPSNTRNSHFYRLANDYYTSQQGIFNDILVSLSSNKPIDNVINNIEKETIFLHEIEGDTEKMNVSGSFDLEKFLNYIVELGRKDEGYYSWSGLKYFLYEYELHLQLKANNNQKVSWTDFNKRKKEDTIEHIYPQTPKDECWEEAFNDKNKNKEGHF
jgi:hypothetical protein